MEYRLAIWQAVFICRKAESKRILTKFCRKILAFTLAMLYNFSNSGFKIGGDLMNHYRELSVNDKIRIARESMGITQATLANALGCGDGTMSRIDNNQGQYNSKQLRLARKFLGIENVPLFGNEYNPFKEQLYSWNGLIKEERFKEAHEKRSELGVIVHLSFEPDLVMLYRMFEIRLLLIERDIDLAREKLEANKHLFHEATIENKYYFYYMEGLLHISEEDFEEALRFFLLAQDLECDDFEKEPYLLYNLALCDAKFGRYFLAISQFEQVYALFNNDRNSVSGMYFDNNLGLNYMRMGHFEKAKALFERGLVRARGVGNEIFAAFMLHNLGCTNFKLRKYKEAIDYFDQAAEYFTEGDNSYLEILYFKSLCLIESRNSLAKTELERAKALSKDNGHYSLLFEALSHLPFRETSSAEYIAKEVVPYLVEIYAYFKVAEFYGLLESFYKRKNRPTKVMEIQALAFELHKKIIAGRNNR